MEDIVLLDFHVTGSILVRQWTARDDKVAGNAAFPFPFPSPSGVFTAGSIVCGRPVLWVLRVVVGVGDGGVRGGGVVVGVGGVVVLVVLVVCVVLVVLIIPVVIPTTVTTTITTSTVPTATATAVATCITLLLQ